MLVLGPLVEVIREKVVVEGSVLQTGDGPPSGLKWRWHQSHFLPRAGDADDETAPGDRGPSWVAAQAHCSAGRQPRWETREKQKPGSCRQRDDLNGVAEVLQTDDEASGVDRFGPLVEVVRGEILVLVSPETQEEQECRIVYLGDTGERGIRVGVEFLTPAPHFWGIDFDGRQPTR